MKFSILVFVCVAAGLATVTASPGGRDIPVTTTLADVQNGSALRVQSDRNGAYVDTKQVDSLIQATTGDWTLTALAARSSRTVFFDLREPVGTGNPTPPITVGYLPAHLIAKCHEVGVGFLNIPAGASIQCPGAFRFEAPDGNSYRLAFSPANYPEVDPIQVTCQKADAGGCKLWTLAPSGTILTGTDANRKNVAKLLQINSFGDILADLGDYYVSFAITVAR
jgi:hypothetical protein